VIEADLKRRDLSKVIMIHLSCTDITAVMAATAAFGRSVVGHEPRASLHARSSTLLYKTCTLATAEAYSHNYRSRGGESEAGDAGACDHTRAVALSRRCAGTYVPLHLQPLAALAALRCLTSAAAARTPTPAA